MAIRFDKRIGVEKSRGYRPSMRTFGWIKVVRVTRSIEALVRLAF